MGELIGYARCSTVLQDLTAQRQALAALGVPDDRIYPGEPSANAIVTSSQTATTTKAAPRRPGPGGSAGISRKRTRCGTRAAST